ncbi:MULTISPECIES: YafY family protein [unclassified Adlercreutzia]|uniref:helix-turn-helix transcriptional regulator n=1 Tax=unclassified Adlercreutzia TaxID=2636013 RepID=UPI0013EC5AB7|nr:MULTISPECIES: WYL domain-containing transcriptional regulator [unclassified Adlercreutzia]
MPRKPSARSAAPTSSRKPSPGSAGASAPRAAASAPPRPAEPQKLKLLHLARMFFQETDEDHGLTMPQILEYLQERGITAERKAIYRDVDALRSFGLDIVTLPRRPVEYALATRRFSKAELLLVADAVQSSRFLTKTQAASLMRSIKALASKYDAKALSSHVHVEGRVRTQNASVFRNVDVIQEALRTRRKITFHYVKYDVHAKEQLQHGGDAYVETPVALIYSNDFYYLVVHNEKHAGFAHYRVDRMRSLICLDERAVSNEATRAFDAGEYLSCAFGMYHGKRQPMTLLVHERAVSGVIDRFGKGVAITPARDVGGGEGAWARVSTPVMQSPALFGWLAQFGGLVRVEGPRELARAYAAHLEEALAAYRDPTQPEPAPDAEPDR